MKPTISARVYDALLRHRVAVLACLAIAVAAAIAGAANMRIDMSFRPTFIGDPTEVERTAAHERVFGQVGFRDLVAMADVHDASDPRALKQVATLADRLRAIPSVIEVRDPLHFPFFDRHGVLLPLGVAGALAPGTSLDSEASRSWIDDLLHTPSARRLVVGDDDRRLAVTASIDIPNEDFSRRRVAVDAFRAVVRQWSAETAIPVEVTGYPEVEQVYAEEVLSSVLRSIALLLAMMVVILFIYFRRWTDVATCLAGVTLSMPVVLGAMRLMGQPFSIVNSQVLTLVLIVGIGQALHHQEEYRRRREAGRDHASANREAFSILAWPSFMTGLATTAGFAALMTADMKAIWSFGLSTALGVAVVYATNWLVVPPLIEIFYRGAPAKSFLRPSRSWTLSIVRGADAILQRHPRLVTLAFVFVTVVLAVAGMSGLSVDQKVNEELSPEHAAVRAELTYERELAGFLGPEFSIEPESKDLQTVTDELVAFVNRLCEMPEVRYVASPLDLLPQPRLGQGPLGKSCRRDGGDLRNAVAARQGAAGPAVEALSTGLLAKAGDRAAVIVRLADIGTARSLPIVEQMRAVARETMPHATVRPVGQWWLAQQGMNRLSFDIMFSAITALLVILPIMWAAIRDFRLFVAAIPPTILPVLATLGFMGLAHITVRIGTAMILAIALGLAADDTVHLSVRIRERIRTGSDPASAVTATLLRTGRPCSFSSYVLIGGFASMMASSLIALQAMGLIAVFTMTFALATDIVLGPAIYLLLRPRRPTLAERTDADLSLSDMLAHVVHRHPERPAMTYCIGDGVWHTVTWHELARVVLRIAQTLDQTLKSARTVAVLGATDARYPLLELALGLTGRVTQPLYVESSDDEIERALVTTGAPVLIAGASQGSRARELHTNVVRLDAIVELPGVGEVPHSVLPANVEPFDTTVVRARLATLSIRATGAPLLHLQSTGTTGPARVIELSEAAIVKAVRTVKGEASHPFPRFLSFLPTAHISERFLTLYVSLAVAGHTWHGGGLETLAVDLRACRPTVLLAPPLLLAALRAEAISSASSTRIGRFLLASVETTAGAMLATKVVGAVRRSIGAWFFGRRLRQSAGLDEVRDALAGTAPLAPRLHAWFEAVGIPLRIVYGQTELAGAISITARRGATFGSVGVRLAGVEVALTSSGEMLVRSEAVFTRYVNDAAATEAARAGGWLHTGDRARLLPTGEVVLMGRVQSIVTAPDGIAVDTAVIGAEVERVFGKSDVVFHRVTPGSGAYMYVAIHGTAAREPCVIPEHDPRWNKLATLMERIDPRQSVRAWAIFDAAFGQPSGEVGPTGKPRAWRIHELRRRSLQDRSTRDDTVAISYGGTPPC
jgi:predicted RND superfamily exporter protein/long-subunit acyl-CoA synthetase (AMP-forming)